ncbi:MAG: YeeE/YedE thiosulfate transporter family protein, partial [Hyphomicrobiales bacterium]
NRGCAVSSLSRLMDGDLAMAATLLGMLFGATAEIVLAVNAVVPAPLPAAAAFGPGVSWLPIALAGLALWALWEASRIARAHGPAGTVRARIAAERYRLSTAAALIGVCNAALFFIFGTWIFTGALVRTVTGLVGTPTAMLWGLFAAVLAGMMVSSVQRGSFSLRRPQAGRAAIHFTGGALMGFGAAMAPGGNDALILDTIPGLSPHAVPTFLAMLAGIVAGLGVMRLFGGTIPPVRCTGDICVSD